MIVDMACPGCGGRSTEYDERKWLCLKCGNKFIYAPAEAPATTIHNVVTIAGEAPFELDVSRAVAARKLFRRRADDPQTHSQLTVMDTDIRHLEQDSTVATVWVAVYGFGALYFGVLTLNFLFKGEGGFFVTLIPAALLIRGLLNRYPKLIAQKNQLRESRRLRIEYPEGENFIGYQPLCPYCHAEIAATETTIGRCVKCGKPSYYIANNSYPIKAASG